jgi:hypothetical protein
VFIDLKKIKQDDSQKLTWLHKKTNKQVKLGDERKVIGAALTICIKPLTLTSRADCKGRIIYIRLSRFNLGNRSVY